MSFHYIRMSSWWRDREILRMHYPCVVERQSAADLDAIYAWCQETYGDTDVVVPIEHDPNVSFEVDLNGIWGHFDGKFWFKDAANAMAFKLRWC